MYRKEGCIMVKEVQVDVDEYNRVQMIYTDGTGRFPKTSRNGMNCVLVLAEIDSGAILAEAMRDRSSGEMVRAYKALIERLHKCKIFPKKQVLNNEISQAYKDAIAEYEIKYELVPPHDHRHNIAEKAIQTFKNHFVLILCGTDKDFPLYLWADLLPQAEHTLNLLRPSNQLPSVSAYAYLYGQNSYD